MFRIAFFSLFVLLGWSCADDPEADGEAVLVENTPEAVAQFWLEAYFGNQFEKAKAYSTASTSEMIDTVQRIMFTDFEESIVFKITALHCDTTAQTANCTYVYVEDNEKIPETVRLKKQNGRWLVDAQLIEEDSDEDAIDLELLKELPK